MSKILNYFSKNLLTRFYLYKYVNFFFNDVSFIDKIKINYFFKNSNISYLTSSILVFKLIFSKIFFNNFKNNFFKVTINLKKGFPFTFSFYIKNNFKYIFIESFLFDLKKIFKNFSNINHKKKNFSIDFFVKDFFFLKQNYQYFKFLSNYQITFFFFNQNYKKKVLFFKTLICFD